VQAVVTEGAVVVTLTIDESKTLRGVLGAASRRKLADPEFAKGLHLAIQIAVKESKA